MSDVTSESNTAWLTDLRILRSRRRAAKQLETVLETYLLTYLPTYLLLDSGSTYTVGDYAAVFLLLTHDDRVLSCTVNIGEQLLTKLFTQTRSLQSTLVVCLTVLYNIPR